MRTTVFSSTPSITRAIIALALALHFSARGENVPLHATPPENPSLAYRWLDIALEVTARDVDRTAARPTVLSRTLAIFATGMYDAWAAYDEKAVGTQSGGSLRRPLSERTLENKQKAISYAAYRTLLYVHPEDTEYITKQFEMLGYDPTDTSTDTTTPEGIGNRVAEMIITFRRHDGANQHGDEVGSSGKPYSDYTFYRCMNTETKVVDPDCWQPITFDNGKGGKVTPGFLTPHWYRVKPFALESAAQFRPPPPPKVGSAQLLKEVQECIDSNAKLDPKMKAVVEFMRDGPRSTGQSGHWLRFAQDVSRRDRHTLDQDVKIYFTVANVAFDAFIACWETKRYYDSSRPWTLVRHYFGDKAIKGWGGPGKGTMDVKGSQWLPYSPATFITPPFPGYVSGHSTVSAACAKALELFTGSDRFGVVERRKCCILTEPIPGEEVSLDLPTFSATAEMAGISRVWGGYHIQADNLEGLKLGRKLAQFEWLKLTEYFNGTAKSPSVAARTDGRR